MQQAFWIAAAAVLEKEGTLPAHLLQRWHECVHENNDPQIVNKILSAAFPNISNLSLDELCKVAAALLEKSLNISQEAILEGHRTEFLEPLRLPLRTRPGLLIFAAETSKLWLASQHHHQQKQNVPAYIKSVEILLWLAETAVEENPSSSNPAFTSFVNLLSHQPEGQYQQGSILTSYLRHFHSFPLEIKLQAMKLIGLCCQVSDSTAFYACWPALENILCSERNEDVLHITACALFEGISSHSSTTVFSISNGTHTESNDPHRQRQRQSHQLCATAAIENGLSCPMPCIQFPGAVASGKILYQQRQQMLHLWDEVLLARVTTAADAAYRIQQDRVGAWGAWQPNTDLAGETAGAAQAPVLHVSSARKLTAQHVLAALEILHKQQYPMNRET